MFKHNKKLSLSRNTVRVIASARLGGVAGGRFGIPDKVTDLCITKQINECEDLGPSAGCTSECASYAC